MAARKKKLKQTRKRAAAVGKALGRKGTSRRGRKAAASALAQTPRRKKPARKR